MNRIQNALILALMFICGFLSGLGAGSVLASDKGLITAINYSAGIVGYPEQIYELDTACTGTIIGRNAILTATHCLSDANHENVIKVRGLTLNFVSRVDDGNDNSLVFFDDNTFPKDDYPWFCKARNIGTDVVMVGNPLGLEGIVRKGYLSGKIHVNGRVYFTYDINVIMGDSGSALIDSKNGCIMSVVHIVRQHNWPGISYRYAISAPSEFTNEELDMVQR